jgi:predicted DNA-binding transcriptional regulator YafY
VAEPYALKEFKNRWYVLANDVKDQQIKSFALDRICDLEISREHFIRPASFNVNDHFRYSFGIVGPNDECPQVVVLSFNAYQGKYIKSMPLHETQQIVVDNDDELRLQLTVYVTHDLIMELLSYGQNVKVLQPESLKNQMRQIYSEASGLY